MLGQTDGFWLVLDFFWWGWGGLLDFSFSCLVLRGKKAKKYGRWSTMFEGCMNFRPGLSSVPPSEGTSRVMLGQSASTGVDKFCVVFSSVYLFVLCKDESLGK